MIEQDGIVVGNIYNKYESKNPVARYLFGSFLKNVVEMVRWTRCSDIHEVGCGEGHLAAILAEIPNTRIWASDFSTTIINKAKSTNSSSILFKACSVYDLDPMHDAASLIVCCEVLEHLEEPEKALEVLSRISKKYILLSVPREPIWRAMNIARGKYLRDWGNTPGHIQHWSRNGFLRLASKYLQILEVRTPLPWTIVLGEVARREV